MSARALAFDDLESSPRYETRWSVWRRALAASMPEFLLEGTENSSVELLEDPRTISVGGKVFVLISPAESVATYASLGEQFEYLTRSWKKDTLTLSSLSATAMHPSYQRIIGLGPDVIPFILRDLRGKGGSWFWALRALTGENPVPPEHRGNASLMADDWLRWGCERNLI